MTLQISVMASTLRRTIEGIATCRNGVNLDERSISSAVKVFTKKMIEDGILKPEEKETMMHVAATAEAIEKRLNERPSIYIWCDVEPEECRRRLLTRDQPDDANIKLAELRALDYYHIKMARELQQEGSTVVVLEKVSLAQRVKQIRELSSFIEGVVTGMGTSGKPQYLKIYRPGGVSRIEYC